MMRLADGIQKGGDDIIRLLEQNEIPEAIDLAWQVQYHRQGVGRSLFEYALQNSTADKITVNSSFYAVNFYHKLGFIDTNVEQVQDGIRFTPMIIRIH